MPKINGDNGKKAPAPPKPKRAKVEPKPIKYEYREVWECVGVRNPDGMSELQYDSVADSKFGRRPALTADEAMEFLGWEAESEDVKFGPDALLKDQHGNGIRLANNLSNRPYDHDLARTWMYEILKGHWQLNGETVVIGDRGGVISAQHRLVALVLAKQEWEKNKRAWEAWKDHEPSLQTLLVLGIEESDKVINTVDTGKPRSAADAIYRSEIFSNSSRKDRKDKSKALAHAVAFLWSRTGAKVDAFAPRRTHTETFTYVENHERLVQCVEHIYDEGRGGTLAPYMTTGYASALMYLMATCSSYAARYRKKKPRREKNLEWDYWKPAHKFWSQLAKGDVALNGIVDAIVALTDTETGDKPSGSEKAAILVRAWNKYSQNEEFTADELLDQLLEWDDNGKKKLLGNNSVGGIDLGHDLDYEAPGTVDSDGLGGGPGEDSEGSEDSEDDGREEGDPTQEEIREETERIKASKRKPRSRAKAQVAIAEGTDADEDEDIEQEVEEDEDE